MNKKKWALLIICIALVFGYIKLFYKTYNNNAVAQSADCIIAIDVKRITNTIIWNVITTPGQWKAGSIFKRSSGTNEVSWEDMIKLPDYILPFHIKNQPANTWYVVLSIKDKKNFEKGLLQYHFEKLNSNEFTSKDLGISFFKYDDKILLTNNSTGNWNLATVAYELFTKKTYLPKTILERLIDANSHLSAYILENSFLQEPGTITANFDKNQIKISSTLTVAGKFNFTEQNFTSSDSSMCAIGFTQPAAAFINLLSDSNKNKISKALNINIDSVLLQSNQLYNLNIVAIKQKVDSAITYTYDDSFNAIEKKVANNILEPSFLFNIRGDSIINIYNYFLRTNKLEQTDTGQLFTPMPFAKSYCEIKNAKSLNIFAADFKPHPVNNNTNCIFFIHLLLSKIPVDLFKYLPDNVNKVISNIESFHIKAIKDNRQIVINCILRKKKNDLPILKL